MILERDNYVHKSMITELWGMLDPLDQAILRTRAVEVLLQGPERVDSQAQLMQSMLWLCLSGGTNCGKSTLFNLFCGEGRSPVKATASATRAALCQLPNEYDLHRGSPFGPLTPLDHPEQLTTCYPAEEAPVFSNKETRADSLYTKISHGYLGLIDCPDHDSLATENQDVAWRIAQASDLCLYITTPQKYLNASTIEWISELIKRNIQVVIIFNLVEEGIDPRGLWTELNEIVKRTLHDQQGGYGQGKVGQLKYAGYLHRVKSRQELNELHSPMEFLIRQALEGKTPREWKFYRNEEDRAKKRDRALRQVVEKTTELIEHRERQRKMRMAVMITALREQLSRDLSLSLLTQDERIFPSRFEEVFTHWLQKTLKENWLDQQRQLKEGAYPYDDQDLIALQVRLQDHLRANVWRGADSTEASRQKTQIIIQRARWFVFVSALFTLLAWWYHAFSYLIVSIILFLGGCIPLLFQARSRDESDLSEIEISTELRRYLQRIEHQLFSVGDQLLHDVLATREGELKHLHRFHTECVKVLNDGEE